VKFLIDDGFGLTNGWQVWYSETGYNTVPADPGYGISAHITSLPGANVTLSFYGMLDNLVNHAFAPLNWSPPIKELVSNSMAQQTALSMSLWTTFSPHL
jgi:hypothetical protein